MTTIPMKEVAAFLLGEDSLDGYWFGERHPIGPFWWREHLRAALSAPATAPEPVAWLAHYVGRSGMEQEYVSTDKNLADENDASGKARPLYPHPPATAPAWHDAPTVPGLWLNSVFMKVEDVEQWHIDCQLHLECARWFGPIPPDGDKP